MHTPDRHPNFRRTATAALLAAMLVACARTEPPQEPTPASPMPSEETPAGAPDPGTPGSPPPTDSQPPAESPAAPAQPSDEPPPPTDPSPTAKPTSARAEPALESMLPARAPAKLGVPVDLRYSFDAEPLANQPVILHLAAVPRVSGSNLSVSIKNAEGLQVVAGGALTAQKVSAHGVHRLQYSVQRRASAPAELRVLVTMDTPAGSTFGFFGIPLDAAPSDGNSAQKQNSVKQH